MVTNHLSRLFIHIRWLPNLGKDGKMGYLGTFASYQTQPQMVKWVTTAAAKRQKGVHHVPVAGNAVRCPTASAFDYSSHSMKLTMTMMSKSRTKNAVTIAEICSMSSRIARTKNARTLYTTAMMTVPMAKNLFMIVSLVVYIDIISNMQLFGN